MLVKEAKLIFKIWLCYIIFALPYKNERVSTDSINEVQLNKCLLFESSLLFLDVTKVDFQDDNSCRAFSAQCA